jgi:hypothetical protein
MWTYGNFGKAHFGNLTGEKVQFFQGDMLKLQCDAVVAPPIGTYKKTPHFGLKKMWTYGIFGDRPTAKVRRYFEIAVRYRS